MLNREQQRLWSSLLPLWFIARPRSTETMDVASLMQNKAVVSLGAMMALKYTGYTIPVLECRIVYGVCMVVQALLLLLLYQKIASGAEGEKLVVREVDDATKGYEPSFRAFTWSAEERTLHAAQVRPMCPDGWCSWRALYAWKYLCAIAECVPPVPAAVRG